MFKICLNFKTEYVDLNKFFNTTNEKTIIVITLAFKLLILENSDSNLKRLIVVN